MSGKLLYAIVVLGAFACLLVFAGGWLDHHQVEAGLAGVVFGFVLLMGLLS